jgi:hypothetical protein
MMDNDEIIMRIKKHYLFFETLQGIADQDILDECVRVMELLFFSLLKNNIKPKSKL